MNRWISNVFCKFRFFIICLCAVLGLALTLGRGGFPSEIQASQGFSFQLKAEDHYVQGLQYDNGLRSGPPRALISFTQAIRLNPNYAEAYFGRGKIQIELGKPEKAINDLTQAIQLKPDYAEAYFYRAKAYYQLGQKLQAVEDLTQAIRISPTYAEAYYQRGLIYTELQNKQAAIEDYIQVIKLDPKKVAYRGDNTRAIRDYKKNIQQNIDFAHAYYLGLASFFTSGWGYIGDLSDTGRDIKKDGLDRAIQLNPNYAEAYYFLGRTQSDFDEGTDDKQKAILNFNQAIQLNPNFAEAFYYRGLAYYQGRDDLRSFDLEKDDFKNARAAISDFTQAIRLNPGYAEAYYQRGLARYRVNDEQGSLKDFVQALGITFDTENEMVNGFIQTLQNNPDYAEAYYQRGIVRFKLENFLGAYKDFTQAIQLNPRLAEAYYYRGLIGRITEPYDPQVKSDFTEAIRLKPRFVGAYFERGFVIIGPAMGLVAKQIIGDMTQVIRLNPYLAEAYYARAYASAPGLQSYGSDRNPTELVTRAMQEDTTQAIRVNHNFAYTYYQAGYIDCGGRGKPIPIKHFDADFFTDANYASATRSIYELLQLEQTKARITIKDKTQNLITNPQDTDALYSRGTAYFQLRDAHSAIQDFTRVLEINAEDADAYYSRGFARYREKDYQGAIQDFTKSLRINPDSADTYLRRGITYYDLGKYHQAYEDTTQAIRLDPVFGEAFFVRQQILRHLGGEDLVERDYLTDPGVDPCYSGCCGGSSIQGNAITFFNRGRIFARQGDKRGAIENLQQAATLFQAQGNISRYQEVQNLIRKLK